MLAPFSFMGGAIDPDAQAFFSRVTAAGGTLTTTEQTAVNTLVLNMKSAGIWNSMRAIYPMVGASAAACAQNLKSSSFTGTFSSGWTFASTGVTPNGTSAFMDTGFVPSTNGLTYDNNHISFYSRTSAQSGAIQYYEMGSGNNTGSNNYSLFIRRNTDLAGYDSGDFTTNRATFTNTNGNGFYCGSAITTSSKYFKNGTSQVTKSLSVKSVSNLNVYIGAFNENNTIIYYSIRECSFASMGLGLTDTQASDFYNLVQIFNTTLNRSVGTPIVSDADAQDFINRVYTAGGTLTNTEANAVNQLVIDMKAAGIWTSMRAVYPMVGSSAAACAQNLRSSSFTGTFTSGWTFASTGVTPNGTSAYMDSGLVPSTSLSQDNFSISYYSRTNSNASATTFPTDIGSFGGSASIGVFLYRPTLTPKGGGGGYAIEVGDNTISSSRYFGFVSRTTSTSQKFSRNGVILATNTTLDTGARPNLSITLGKANGLSNFANRECAFAHVGDGLTDTQASDFYNLVQTFQTTLNRQI